MTNNLIGMILFLTVFSVALGLLINDIRGSVVSGCTEKYNITANYSKSSDLYGEVINKYNKCVDANWSGWYYGIFIAPIGVALAIAIKKGVVF